MTTFTLDSVTDGGALLPPRFVVYGEHGIGKTTFAASAASPIVIRTEDGLAAMRVPTFPIARSYGDVLAALGALYSQPHGYATVVLDSLDWLEPLVWARTCLEHGKQAIEDFGYGKGYQYADEFWLEILNGLDALRQRGMTIVLIAHAEIRRFDAPDTDPYDRWGIKLHRRAAGLVEEWADIVGFARYEVNTTSKDVGFNKKVTRGIATGSRLLSVENRPAFRAKNRYQLPADLPLSWQSVMQAIAPAFAAPAAPTESPIEELASA